MNERVVVVGGGVAGLAAAHRLRERGADVLLLEASARCGGMLRTERTDGYVIERGPDSIITSKPAALALAEALGLGRRIVRTREENRGAYVVRGGRLHRVPDGFQLLAPSDLGALWRSPVLDLGGKVRASLEPLVPRASHHDESLASFVRRRLGDDVLARLAQPMAGGIYGADPEQLSLRATLPRFLETEARDGSLVRSLRRARLAGAAAASGARYGLFISFDEGIACLPEALEEHLADVVRTERPVSSLRRVGGAWEVDGERAAAVVLAIPAARAGGLLGREAPEIATRLRAIRHGSAATVTLAYAEADIPRPLDAAGFVVPATEGRAVMAGTWSSAKWHGRAPSGQALLRVFLGGHGRQEVVRWSDEELEGAARRSLRDLMGIVAAPSLVRVDRWREKMPRYEVGHARRIDDLIERLGAHPRLQLAGNAYRGVGIPDAIASGQSAADAILATL